MNISAAGNTDIPMILLLEAKGYEVSCSENGEDWVAYDDGNTYRGGSPAELVALVTMHVYRGDSWKATDHEIERCMNQYIGLG